MSPLEGVKNQLCTKQVPLPEMQEHSQGPDLKGIMGHEKLWFSKSPGDRSEGLEFSQDLVLDQCL